MQGPSGTPTPVAAAEPLAVSDYLAADSKGVPPLFGPSGEPAPPKAGARVAARVAYTKELIEDVVKGLGK